MNLYINKNNTHAEILQSLKEKVQAESEVGETEMTLIFVKTTVHYIYACMGDKRCCYSGTKVKLKIHNTCMLYTYIIIITRGSSTASEH